MNVLVDGILLGLVLSIMAGPIFFTIVQASIEDGIPAGTAVGAGVWLSDVAYILVVYLGIAQIAEWSGFKLYTGLIGGGILICFGIVMTLKKVKMQERRSLTARNLGEYFMKGVLINIFNPFVLLLWIGVTSTMMKNNLNPQQSILFFTCIMLTVAISDMIKVVLAKRIRDYMRPVHLLWTQRIAGFGLIIFGIALMIRVML